MSDPTPVPPETLAALREWAEAPAQSPLPPQLLLALLDERDDLAARLAASEAEITRLWKERNGWEVAARGAWLAATSRTEAARLRKAVEALAMYADRHGSTFCELIATDGDGPRHHGGCPHYAVGVKVEDGFVDRVCQKHAESAAARGAVVAPRAALSSEEAPGA